MKMDIARKNCNMDSCAYHIFVLADQLYALEADKILEITVGYNKQIIPVSGLKSFVAGVIKLGHEEIQVIDLHSKLQIDTAQQKSRSHTIIIVEAMLNKRRKKIGFIADSFIKTIIVREGDKIATSLFKPEITQFFVSGYTPKDKEVIKILDVEAILADIKKLSEFSR